MNPGKLRHRITIKAQPPNQGSYGQTVEDTNSWDDIATTWAAVEPLSGRELFAAQQYNSEITVRVRIRYRLGIIPAMRIVYGSRVFDILYPIDPEERHKELQLMCKELMP